MLRMLFAAMVVAGGGVGLMGAAETARSPAPGERQLFTDALRNTAQDRERWAFTEREVMHASKGRPRGETVYRFDPSRPYAEQYTPLKVDGKAPSARDLRKYRERGEKRGARLAKAAEAAARPVPAAPQLNLGGGKAQLDVAHPLVAREEPESITFEVPILGRQAGIPVDKFQVFIRVNRSTRLVENVRIHLRESFRIKLVAKVKAGEASVDFRVVDPRFGPVPVSFTGDFGLSLLFLPVNATVERTRSEWQRVKPYDERFQVKIGPLEALDF